MARSARTDYEEPITLWAFCPIKASVFPVKVVAETESSIWMAPHEEMDKRGRTRPPIQRMKRAFRTFHDFEDAKSALWNELAKKRGDLMDRLEAVNTVMRNVLSMERNG
jgi:hypothetical protein